MKAPTPKSRALKDNWLVVARIPGVTFALAALLLPTAAAAGIAPATLPAWMAPEPTAAALATPALPAVLEPAAPVPQGAEATPPATSRAPPAAVEADPPTWPFATGQRLTPEEVEWFHAQAQVLKSQGVLRGNPVYASWS